MRYPWPAFVAGWLAERGLDRGFGQALAAMAAGLAVIFACGLAWLTLQLAPVAGGRALELALQAGLYPFVAIDIVKLFVAAAILPGAWALIGKK